jgi:hypothetical protein
MPIKLSREQLYERVWAVPIRTLAKEFGISNVAVAKACRRANVPVPGRGYWAKVQANKNPRRTPLPGINNVRLLSADQIAEQATQARIPLPPASAIRHKIVCKFEIALRRAKPDGNALQGLTPRAHRPCLRVTARRITRAIRALHALVIHIESRGFRFAPSTWVMGRARPTFVHGPHEVTLGISEILLPAQGSRPSGQEPERRLSGHFELRVEGAYTDHTWVEESDRSLEKVLYQIAEHICRHFADCDRRDIAQQDWQVRQALEEAKRKEMQRKAEHEAAIARILQERKTNAYRASRWWRLHKDALAFLEECRARWINSHGSLTAQQSAWLVWARGEAARMSPFEMGYPNPELDGPLDREAVPFGGPYPQSRQLPDPDRRG